MSWVAIANDGSLLDKVFTAARLKVTQKLRAFPLPDGHATACTLLSFLFAGQVYYLQRTSKCELLKAVAGRPRAVEQPPSAYLLSWLLFRRFSLFSIYFIILPI
jgi:hypothetical protein